MASKYWKVEGTGNVCIVCESKYFPENFLDKQEFVKKIALESKPHADQILELQAPLTLQIWNRDGSLAEMCGNGLRAFMHLAENCKWVEAREGEIFSVSVSKNICEVMRLKDRGDFSISMGEVKGLRFSRIQVLGHSIPCYQAEIGNPHTIIFWGSDKQWKKPQDFSLQKYGPALEEATQSNIAFVDLHHKANSLGVEVWERGAGATQSCASNAMVIAACYEKYFSSKLGSLPLEIQMPGGLLTIRNTNGKRWLSGASSILESLD